MALVYKNPGDRHKSDKLRKIGLFLGTVPTSFGAVLALGSSIANLQTIFTYSGIILTLIGAIGNSIVQFIDILDSPDPTNSAQV